MTKESPQSSKIAQSLITDCPEVCENSEGILLIDKPPGKTSFFLVKVLRKITGIKKIGHAGTLDPFATGLMIMLLGKSYTKRQDIFLNAGKEYVARVQIGVETDTFDLTGNVTSTSSDKPDLKQIKEIISHFQGNITQTPPMYSAKKVDGKKLYELARKGIEIPRKEIEIKITTTLLSYSYPFIDLHISCSKGTYIRSIAHDMGKMLGTGAHLYSLERTKCGSFTLSEAIDMSKINSVDFDYRKHLKKLS